MRLAVCASALGLLFSASAYAQMPPPAAPPPAAPPPAMEAVPPPPPPPPPPVVEVAPPPAAAPVAVVAPGVVPVAPAAAAVPMPKFTFGGLVDTYWMYNFTKPDGANSLYPPTGGLGRAFDTNANSITLALAKLSMNASLDPVSLQLDIGYGSVGSIINGAASGGSPPSAPISQAFLVEQAYGEIALPGNLTLDFGKFVTTAGAEVIEANKNWLYSRSMLFNVIPLLHTGVRANLKVNDNLTLQASLVNGWNNDPDNNSWKTGGVSATITVNPMVSVIATTYFGKEATQGPAGSTPGDMRFLGDVVVALNLSDRLGINLNIDYLKAPPAAVFTMGDVGGDYLLGASAMARYVVADHLYLAARAEYVDVHNDAASRSAHFEEGTVMAGIPVGRNFELRPEFRGDFSSEENTFALNKKSQFTGELAALTFF